MLATQPAAVLRTLLLVATVALCMLATSVGNMGEIGGDSGGGGDVAVAMTVGDLAAVAVLTLAGRLARYAWVSKGLRRAFHVYFIAVRL